MTAFGGSWSESEVRRYLEATTVPIRLACHRRDGTPWIVTLWYRYRDGVLECSTSADADLVRFLRGDTSVGFDVSTNEPPYRGIRGNGTVVVDPDDDKTVLRDLVGRYLGTDESSLARWLLSDDREEVRIEIRPDRIYSWDYSKRMETVA